MGARHVAIVVCVLVGPASAEPRYELAAAAGVMSSGDVAAPIAAVSFGLRVLPRVVADVEVAGYGMTMASAAHLAVAPVLARVAYRYPWRRGEVWAGGGAGAAFASTELAGAGDRAVVPAASAFVGLSARVGPAHASVETSYLRASLRSDAYTGRIGGAVAIVGVAVGF